jgi:hypothetical protein
VRDYPRAVLQNRTQTGGSVGHYRVWRPWPATAHELTQLQQALGELTPEHWQQPANVLRIGACFVCFERVHGAGGAGDKGFAGAAVTHRRQLMAGVTSSGSAGGPYLPAMLALPASHARPPRRTAA